MGPFDEFNLKVREAVLSPKGWSDDWKNTKRLLIVHKDGSYTGRVLLTVPDARHREQLICLHFLTQLAMMGEAEFIGANLWSRDDPWDFRIELSTGETFNLEITSIADSNHSFEMHGREAELARVSNNELIPLRKLVKLEANFPDEGLAQVIAELRTRGTKLDDLVKNPFCKSGTILFMGRFEPSTESLTKKLGDALAGKLAKPHGGKEETVIIVDNRTTGYDLRDFKASAVELEERLLSMPFPEIWVYTGYCSNDDGTSAEFSLLALKTTRLTRGRMLRLATERGVDEHCRIIL